MLSFFKKGTKKDLNCCNIQIEEIKEGNISSEEKEDCCSTEEKDVCCSTENEKANCC